MPSPIIPPDYTGPYWYRYVNVFGILQGERHIAEVEHSTCDGVLLLLPLRNGFIPDVIKVQVGDVDHLGKDRLLVAKIVDYSCHDGVTPAKPTRIVIKR